MRHQMHLKALPTYQLSFEDKANVDLILLLVFVDREDKIEHEILNEDSYDFVDFLATVRAMIYLGPNNYQFHHF